MTTLERNDYTAAALSVYLSSTSVTAAPLSGSHAALSKKSTQHGAPVMDER